MSLEGKTTKYPGYAEYLKALARKRSKITTDISESNFAVIYLKQKPEEKPEKKECEKGN